MGNCQTADAAAPAAEIQHSDGKIDRIYWPINACHVMTENPGFYVAAVQDSVNSAGERSPASQVKLLRPDDTLLVGHVYRLISFEDVIRDFSTKKRMRLSRLLQKQKARDERRRNSAAGDDFENGSSEKVDGGELLQRVGSTIICNGGRQGQWRPTLQSIAEMGI